MSDAVIIARRVGLSIPLIRAGARSLLANPLAVVGEFYMPGRRREVRPILRNLSFDVNHGDRLGLIGVNGAGKTTLLRMLAGVMTPTSGTLEVDGEVHALLSVGMGMQNDATGLENIYINGLSIGLSLATIREIIPDIVDFAELGSAIYDPVSTYSAGMRLRLAFAVATSTTPEILLLDEWLSAGDQFFMQKAKERLEQQIKTSKVLVLASHSTEIIRSVCNRGFVMLKGEIIFDGDIESALKYYSSDSYREELAKSIAG